MSDANQLRYCIDQLLAFDETVLVRGWCFHPAKRVVGLSWRSPRESLTSLSGFGDSSDDVVNVHGALAANSRFYCRIDLPVGDDPAQLELLASLEDGTTARLQLPPSCPNPALKVRGPLRPSEADLLSSLAFKVHSGCIVEIGSFHGRSTVALAYGSTYGTGAPVYAIDPHEPSIAGPIEEYGPFDRITFIRNIGAFDFTALVRFISLSSEVVSVGWHQPIALLWIDGDHSLEAVRRDFRCWEPFLMPGSLVAFHDSIDPALGPIKVIQAALATGRYKVERVVERTTVLRCLRRPRLDTFGRIYGRFRTLVRPV
jgi:predicted O-methyltransferase YrrM